MPRPFHVFPAAIAHYRGLAGLTQRVLAERLGIAQPELSALETGVSLPTWSLAGEIARILSVDVDLLYADDVVDLIRRGDA